MAASIEEIGVQVPISVFSDAAGYVIIDGERRWRACAMINLKTIPAIVYPKPSPLQNLVFMFNIHKFRLDWDPLPAAMKLKELEDLWQEEEGRLPTESQLAALTGMNRGTVRRCRLILEIPETYRQLILRELEKPEKDRRITTDLFIEAQRAVRTLRTYLPELSLIETGLLNSLIEKYRNGVIGNVVHMRLVAKIARAGFQGVDRDLVTGILLRLRDDSQYSVLDAYAEIAWVYDVREFRNQLRSLESTIDLGGRALVKDNPELRSFVAQLIQKLSRLIGQK